MTLHDRHKRPQKYSDKPSGWPWIRDTHEQSVARQTKHLAHLTTEELAEYKFLTRTKHLTAIEALIVIAIVSAINDLGNQS